MQHEGWTDSAAIFQILADDYARRILVVADQWPMTAKALSEDRLVCSFADRDENGGRSTSSQRQSIR